MIVTTANNMIDAPIGDSDGTERNILEKSGCSRPNAPDMPARSIRSPPAACRSRSAKPPRPSPS